MHVTTSFYWDCWWGVSFPPKFGWTNLKMQILCIESHSFTNQQLLFLSYRPGSAETFMATAWADRHRGEWGSPPSPASPLPLHDSLTPLLSSPFTFENPFMPWLILRCTGHTLPDSRGALETASGFWKKFRTSDKAPDSPPGEELCGKCCPVPFPLQLSSHHPPCHWQWMEGSLQV